VAKKLPMNEREPITVDRLLAEGWFSTVPSSPWPVIAEYTLDGVRLGSVPYRMQLGPHGGAAPSVHETRLEKSQGEAFFAATILWRLGYRAARLTKSERPAFQVSVEGSEIGLEISQIVEADSARWRNSIEDLRIAVLDALDSDPAARVGLRGRYVSVSFWRCPKKSAVLALRDEVLAFVTDGAMFTLPHSRVVDPRFPLMSEHWAHVHVSDSEVGKGVIDVCASAYSFARDGLIGVALERLEEKRERAVAYDATRPLWLGLFITDQRGLFGETLQQLGRLSPTIAPYELVAVYYDGALVVWHRDTPCPLPSASKAS
jgi:hypothetical protein